MDTDAAAAMQLVQTPLDTATPAELLESADLFADGLTRFKEHNVPLESRCTSKITVAMDASVEGIAEAIVKIGYGCHARHGTG